MTTATQKSKTKVRTRQSIDPVNFVKVYNTSDNLDEVSQRMGIGYGSVVQKAHNLKKAGVNLKPMRRRGRPSTINVDLLNSLPETRKIIQKMKRVG